MGLSRNLRRVSLLLVSIIFLDKKLYFSAYRWLGIIHKNISRGNKLVQSLLLTHRRLILLSFWNEIKMKYPTLLSCYMRTRSKLVKWEGTLMTRNDRFWHFPNKIICHRFHQVWIQDYGGLPAKWQLEELKLASCGYESGMYKGEKCAVESTC